MATVERAEALLEELRGASIGAARRDLDEVRAFAKAQVGSTTRVLGRAF